MDRSRIIEIAKVFQVSSDEILSDLSSTGFKLAGDSEVSVKIEDRAIEGLIISFAYIYGSTIWVGDVSYEGFGIEELRLIKSNVDARSYIINPRINLICKPKKIQIFFGEYDRSVELQRV